MKKAMEDFVNEARDYKKNYRKEMYENLLNEVDDIPYSSFLLSNAYATHEGGNFHLNLNKI